MKKSMMALLRISLGWIFLWAFIDKTFGFYFPTLPEDSWLAGASPTSGFLNNASGALAPLFSLLVGLAWVDWLFMLGLLGVGIALTFGIAMKIAAISGSIMMGLMYLAVYPTNTNPLLDDHIIYILVFIVLYVFDSGKTLGLGESWQKTKLVKNYPILK